MIFYSLVYDEAEQLVVRTVVIEQQTRGDGQMDIQDAPDFVRNGFPGQTWDQDGRLVS